MKKYIRTNDGIYKTRQCYPEETLFENVTYVYKHEFVKNKDIIAKADTIEELCDEFISVYQNLTPELLEPKFVSPREPLSVSWKNRLEDEHLFKDNVVYGAIWTDKGLIYVAKMNEKGDLELL